MLNPRLIVAGPVRPSTLVTLLRKAGRLPALDFYGLQKVVLGLFAEPLYWLQRLIYRHPQDMPDPVFIVGCWRSGTTWLLEQLVRQTDSASVRTRFQVCPQASLLLKPILERASFSLPNRFVDWMPIDGDGPLEAECAFFGMGSELPTARIGINEEFGQVCEEWAAWTPTRQWKRQLRRVFGWGWIYDRKPGRPYVLKTPAHTLQIQALLASRSIDGI